MLGEDFKDYRLRPSKHFVLGWMKKWGWDEIDLMNALKNAYNVEKIGKYKYESYTRNKGKSKKLIFIIDEDYKEIFVITGTERK